MGVFTPFWWDVLFWGEVALYHHSYSSDDDIFRYDQFVHIVGFGAATLMMAHLFKPLLKPGAERTISFAILLIMAGLGVGAVNELVEFAVTLVVPNNGVGGYMNTCLDLAADTIGAVVAWG
ncbi:MAG: hypothetical protein WCP97_07110, partial [bacterium]